jgi:nitrite reductase (NADH) large subunit
MIVCHCKGVTDRAIRRAVRGGARTRGEVVQTCEASRSCGGCGPAVDAIIESELSGERDAVFATFTEFAVPS